MATNSDLPAISLFSGGGGLDLGIARAGFQTRVAVEWEKYACATLRRNQANHRDISDHAYLDGCAVLEGDIRSFSAASILTAARLAPGEAALLVGGPPCVTFSVAGSRAGLGHETGQLYSDFVRVLKASQPRAFIFENVKGLLTAPGDAGEIGGAFKTILAALEAAGYALTWRVVDAADYGVPQHRHRLIILGRRGKSPLQFPEPTHADPDKAGLFADAGILDPWRTVEDAISDLPPAVLLGETPTVPNHVARRYSEDVIRSLAATPQGKRNPRYKRDRLRWDRPAKAIRAQGKLKADGSGQKNSSHQSIHPEEHRQITVREAAQIQTFPDWYEFDATLVNGYRVVGDAVPPVLAEALARSVRVQLWGDSRRNFGRRRLSAPERQGDSDLVDAAV